MNIFLILYIKTVNRLRNVSDTAALACDSLATYEETIL